MKKPFSKKLSGLETEEKTSIDYGQQVEDLFML